MLGLCTWKSTPHCETRKSTEGFVFLIGGGALSWRSKKQRVVAAPSCESEYIAAYSGPKEGAWLSRMFSAMLGYTSSSPISIYIDNQGCIETAKGSSTNSRNKHIDIRFHFVRDLVAEQHVQLKYISTTDQVADPLAKPLGRVQFNKLISKMELQSLERTA